MGHLGLPISGRGCLNRHSKSTAILRAAQLRREAGIEQIHCKHPRAHTQTAGQRHVGLVFSAATTQPEAIADLRGRHDGISVRWPDARLEFPFPCVAPQGWDAAVPFPGPKGSLLLFDSPDRLLLSWSRQQQCDGHELERIEQGCMQLLDLREQGAHRVQPNWGNDANAPQPDGILAGLLLATLQANPDALAAYLQLDPAYLHRLIRSQRSPRQLLTQYPQRNAFAVDDDEPLQRQLQAALAELNRHKNRSGSRPCWSSTGISSSAPVA